MPWAQLLSCPTAQRLPVLWRHGHRVQQRQRIIRVPASSGAMTSHRRRAPWAWSRVYSPLSFHFVCSEYLSIFLFIYFFYQRMVFSILIYCNTHGRAKLTGCHYHQPVAKDTNFKTIQIVSINTMPNPDLYDHPRQAHRQHYCNCALTRCNCAWHFVGLNDNLPPKCISCSLWNLTQRNSKFMLIRPQHSTMTHISRVSVVFPVAGSVGIGRALLWMLSNKCALYTFFIGQMKSSIDRAVPWQPLKRSFHTFFIG